MISIILIVKEVIDVYHIGVWKEEFTRWVHEKRDAEREAQLREATAELYAEAAQLRDEAHSSLSRQREIEALDTHSFENYLAEFYRQYTKV